MTYGVGSCQRSYWFTCSSFTLAVCYRYSLPSHQPSTNITPIVWSSVRSPATFGGELGTGRRQ